VDQILTGAMEAVEEAGSHLKQTVWGPVIKATALVRGIQAGLEFLRSTRRGRESAEVSTENQDEGMFI
jgi:delta 1-pyrroline-5-carboxylate dehydrogenase